MLSVFYNFYCILLFYKKNKCKNLRFGSHTEEYIIAKRQNVVPKNTAKANKAGANLLRAYLTEKIWKVNIH
jgi:hypothetical protein